MFSSCSPQLRAELLRTWFTVRSGRCLPERITSTILGESEAHRNMRLTNRRVRPACRASWSIDWMSPPTIRSYQSRVRAIRFTRDGTGLDPELDSWLGE